MIQYLLLLKYLYQSQKYLTKTDDYFKSYNSQNDCIQALKKTTEAKYYIMFDDKFDKQDFFNSPGMQKIKNRDRYLPNAR